MSLTAEQMQEIARKNAERRAARDLAKARRLGVAQAQWESAKAREDARLERLRARLARQTV